MAQKKQLSKNRKRKLLKRFQLTLSLRSLFVDLHRASQPKPPTLKPGGIMSEIKPWTHPEPMTPFFTKARINEAIRVGLDQADPKQFVIAYNNEAGTIGVMMSHGPIPEKNGPIESSITPVLKDGDLHIPISDNLRSALFNNTGKFVWPHQDTADY